jgi:uncharacterized protein (TIGR01777 family)
MTAVKTAVTGSTGLIGSALVPLLRSHGHEVSRVVRGRPAVGTRDIEWDPAHGKLDPESLEGFDAVVHLSGEPIDHRWTAGHKAKIRRSRVDTTRLLATTMASLGRPPRVFVSTSAIGIYGNRGNEWLDESSSHGSDFLARICEEWEAAADPARDAGIRVVHPRFGVIVSPDGGALGKLLAPFRLGAGGKAGSGDQWLSWVARDDATGAIRFLIDDPDISGPVNVVAPNPETNERFAKTLGHVLGRPAVTPVPAIALRLMFGAEMADATVLASQRVRPKALDEHGFRFQFPYLEAALRHELGKERL